MKRTPGAELMQAFFKVADKKGYRSFFYGDTEHTLVELRKKLATDYPGHEIAGTFSPPFRPLTQKEDQAVIQMINAAHPDVLWVALGLPKQERWIYERRYRLKVPIAIGVGAAFAFVSGDVRRVPEWIGDCGLEWLWRFIQEPAKLWKRDLIDGPRFLWHASLELVRERREDTKLRKRDDG
jgi:N-acetylglucosaminyldiphosphoundecaprenol N-acetyl-beta-D-mannosaminyltransferase